MKGTSILLTVLLAVVMISVGCGQREEQPAAPAAAPQVQAPAMPKPAAEPAKPAAPVATDEFSKIRNAFADAEEGTRGTLEDAVAAVKAAKYAEALPMLQKLLADAQLTPQQQQLLKDLLAQVQQKMAGAATQEAVAGAEKAAGDLPKSLPLPK